MINWQNLIKNVDQKDIEDYSELREGNSKPGMLNGILFSKKSGKGYNIVVQTNTDQLLPTSLVRVYCNCDDFKFRWAYVLHKFEALIAPQNFILLPPKQTNPNMTVGCCKHIKVFLEKANAHSLARLNMVKGQI